MKNSITILFLVSLLGCEASDESGLMDETTLLLGAKADQACDHDAILLHLTSLEATCAIAWLFGDKEPENAKIGLLALQNLYQRQRETSMRFRALTLGFCALCSFIVNIIKNV